jgi:hypothetical protein
VRDVILLLLGVTMGWAVTHTAYSRAAMDKAVISRFGAQMFFAGCIFAKQPCYQKATEVEKELYKITK